MDRKEVFDEALQQLQAQGVNAFTHADVLTNMEAQIGDPGKVRELKLTPQWVGGELRRRADAGELILTEEGRDKHYSFPPSNARTGMEDNMATAQARKGGLEGIQNGAGTAGNLTGLNPADFPQRQVPAPEAGGKPSSLPAGDRILDSPSHQKEREELAGRCAAWYNRLRQYAHDVLLENDLDIGSRVRRKYFLENLSDEDLSMVHNQLEGLCKKHASPIPRDMATNCVRRLQNPALDSVLGSLTDEQRSFVKRVQRSDNYLKIVRYQRLDFIQSFLAATAAIEQDSRRSGQTLLNGLQRANSSAESRRSSTHTEARVPAQRQIPTKPILEDHRVSEGNVVRERDTLKRDKEALERQITLLTEERDKLTAEKKTAEERVTELERELASLRDGVKAIEGAWTTAFTDVPDAAMLSSEGVTALKQHLVWLENQGTQAAADRDEAQQARDDLQKELDDRPTTEQLAGVREDLATCEEHLANAKAWRSFAWCLFGTACTGLLIATIFAITGWSAQREAAQRSNEYYRAWQEATR